MARSTRHVEVVGRDRGAQSSNLDEVRHVEAELLALQHRVRGAGDLPVGRLHPQEVRVAVRMGRVLRWRLGREPRYGSCDGGG